MENSKTPEEMEVEAQRKQQIAHVMEYLHGKELAAEIIRINLRVLKWKLDNPALVQDEIPL